MGRHRKNNDCYIPPIPGFKPTVEPIEWRESQRTAIEAFKARDYNGLLWAPPAFGKTFVACELIRQLREKHPEYRVTLVVQKDTEQQWVDALRKFGIAANDIYENPPSDDNLAGFPIIISTVESVRYRVLFHIFRKLVASNPKERVDWWDIATGYPILMDRLRKKNEITPIEAEKRANRLTDDEIFRKVQRDFATVFLKQVKKHNDDNTLNQFREKIYSPELHEYLGRQILIFDEVHKGVAEMGNALLLAIGIIAPLHRIGLTATLHKKGGYDQILKLIFGGVAYETALDDPDLIPYLAPLELHLVSTGWKNQSSDLANWINNSSFKKIMFFSKKKKLALEFADALDSNKRTIYRVFANQNRDELESFRRKESSAILVTCNVGSVGYNDIDIDCVMLPATASSVRILQQIGRSLRPKDRKLATAIIYSDWGMDVTGVLQTLHVDNYVKDKMKYFKIEKNQATEVSAQDFFPWNREAPLRIPWTRLQRQFEEDCRRLGLNLTWDDDTRLLQSMEYRLWNPPLFQFDGRRDEKDKKTFINLSTEYRSNERAKSLLLNYPRLWPHAQQHFFAFGV